MFTGLVETTGKIISTPNGKSGKLRVKPEKVFENLIYGESIAVNGACQTLVTVESDGTLVFDMLEETAKRTSLGDKNTGDSVNLERAMQLGDRLGGHLVSGHIDTTSEIISIKRNGDDIELKISAPEYLQPYLIEKGSIAIDGISLTLVEVTDKFFTVHLIPVTLAETALKNAKSGDKVNLEGDLIGKYVEKQLRLSGGKTANVTMEQLRGAGW